MRLEFFTSAIGMVVDNNTGFVNVFDPSTETVTDNVGITTGGAEGDCTISPDGSLGFVTNFSSVIQVVDLSVSPAVLAGPPIPISNFGEDVSLTADGEYLVTSDGGALQPLSVIDVGLQTEIGTANVTGSDHNSVEVCADGTVLTTSNSNNALYRTTIDALGVISAPTATAAISNPNNAYCASGEQTAVALSRSGSIQSFSLPALAPLDTQPLSATALAAVFNQSSTVIYVLTSNSVSAWTYDPVSGLFGAQLWSQAASASPFFGMDQIDILADDSRVYVSGGSGPVEILDAATGALLGTLTDPGISLPTGICISGAAAPVNNPPVADAGPDQTIECAGDPTTTVQLNGSGSFDPDPGDSIAAYLWTGGIFTPSDEAANPTVDVPLGVHNFDLMVFDTFGLDDSDSVQITVQDTTDPVIVAPADISVEHTADPQFVSDLDLGMPTVTEACGYTVSRSPAGNLFPVGTTTITWTVTAISDGATASDTQDVVITNTAPVADNQSPSFVEDSVANVITLTASDINNDAPLVFAVVGGSGPSHGTLGGAAPNLTYTPDPDYFGPDEFKFTAMDEHGAVSAEATVSITVTPVNDPPVISISRVTATVQYSDTIGTVTITATDVDDDPLALTSEYTDNGGAPIAGLPSNLGTAGSCTEVPNDTTSPGTTCSWDLTGQMLEDAGDYDITFTVTDGGGGEGTIESDSGATEIIVNPEDATISFDENNEVAIQVDGDGSDSSLPFSLTVYIDETEPDIATFIAMFGDLSLAVPHMQLTPVGPGGPVSPDSCSTSVAGTGYDQVMTYTCDFSGVPVNTYSVDVNVDGGYYIGENDDVFTVFDPSLGFTTGGGWFYWPGTNDKTNFGYTMKYNKKRTNLQGSLLMIRHVEGSVTGEKWRIKSNALEGLSIGSDPDFGWAAFSGKATYRSPTEDNEGNNEFTVYVEDHGVPGAGVDQFWVQTRDKQDDVRPDLSMPEPGAGNTETIEGGNIFVPHTSKGRGK